MAYSNSFLSPYEILPIAQEKKMFREFFLLYQGIVRSIYALESPSRGDSNEFTQHTIIVQKSDNISLKYPHCFLALRQD